jgi:carboxypeptidase Q
MLRLAICVVLFCVLRARAQTPHAWSELPKESESAKRAFPQQLRDDLARLRDAALADDYGYQRLEHLTDSIGPRPEGSPQADAAAHYVADELQKLGLEVRLEPVMVQAFVRGNDSAELVGYPGQVAGATQKIVVTALGGSSPTKNGGLTAEVVVVSSFEELKELGKDKVAGKIVLFDVHFDELQQRAGQAGGAYGDAVEYRGVGAVAAAQVGAVASLVRSVGGANYRIPHTGWSADTELPAGAIAAEDADLIARLAARGPVRLHLSLPSHHGQQVKSYNVIADLKGSERPEQVVVLSGHLDSWDLGTGAIDDGAGVAVAMEAAELIVRLHLRPRRTVRVIAWMNEEQGAAGSLQYAKDYAGDIPNHFAAIESDMGAEHPLGFKAKISQAAAAELSPVQNALRPIGANLIQIVAGSPGTDIEPLADKGVPAFGVWQSGLTYFNYHHTAADTLDKVDPAQLRENAACMALMGYALTQISEPLPQ